MRVDRIRILAVFCVYVLFPVAGILAHPTNGQGVTLEDAYYIAFDDFFEADKLNGFYYPSTAFGTNGHTVWTGAYMIDYCGPCDRWEAHPWTNVTIIKAYIDGFRTATYDGPSTSHWDVYYGGQHWAFDDHIFWYRGDDTSLSSNNYYTVWYKGTNADYQIVGNVYTSDVFMSAWKTNTAYAFTWNGTGYDVYWDPLLGEIDFGTNANVEIQGVYDITGYNTGAISGDIEDWDNGQDYPPAVESYAVQTQAQSGAFSGLSESEYQERSLEQQAGLGYMMYQWTEAFRTWGLDMLRFQSAGAAGNLTMLSNLNSLVAQQGLRAEYWNALQNSNIMVLGNTERVINSNLTLLNSNLMSALGSGGSYIGDDPGSYSRSNYNVGYSSNLGVTVTQDLPGVTSLLFSAIGVTSNLESSVSNQFASPFTWSLGEADYEYSFGTLDLVGGPEGCEVDFGWDLSSCSSTVDILRQLGVVFVCLGVYVQCSKILGKDIFS